MIQNEEFQAIQALDFEQIKTKLAHPEAGEGWSAEQAAAVETEYKRFLYLMKANPEAQIAPSEDIDTFWHYHILDTMKYAADCQTVFGHFLHHFPYLGLRGGDDARNLERAGEQMCSLYESTFGVRYGSVTAAWCSRSGDGIGAQAAAWCSRSSDDPPVKPGAAWCSRSGDGIGAQATAWCSRSSDDPPVKPGAAWCSRSSDDPPVKPGAAWCSAPADASALAVNESAAWCARAHVA